MGTIVSSIKELDMHGLDLRWRRFVRSKLVPWSSAMVFTVFTFSVTAQTFLSSNLPVIVINTNNQSILDEPKITADMGIIDNGPGQRNYVSDPFNNYAGKIGIEIRGSSSQMFPKKQYGIELRDATGNGISMPLLGMPAEEDWVLFAPYNDKSLMRDVLAYKLGRDLGRYAPRTRYCELVLNGQYQGVYVLIEKIKRDKNRVDVKKLEPTDNSGNSVTGGYIIKIDKESGSGNGGWISNYAPPGRSGDQRIYYQYDYPKAANITAQQRTYIQQYMSTFEATLIGTDFANPVVGYTRFVDVDSFIDFFIVNEVSKNVDGYRLSTYLHKQRDSDGGKLLMGPVWDFNLGFGNCDYCTTGTPTGWVTSFNSVCPQDYWLIPFWWNRLYQDSNYRNRLAVRWAELRADKFSTPRIHAYIDSVYTVLNSESAIRNFQKWPVLGQYVWPNFYVGSTFQSEVVWLKDWVTNRMNWLDLNMPKIVTGVEVKEFKVSVFPNPFHQELQVEYELEQGGDFTFEVCTPLGQSVVKHYQTQAQAGTYRFSVQAETPLLPGVYFYKAKRAGVEVTGRIVKLD
ncbi:MAG: CotH kinase family protein [Cytophagales bacterium]|nr:CotH kinase family protein [Cytophagales bacterium]